MNKKARILATCNSRVNLVRKEKCQLEDKQIAFPQRHLFASLIIATISLFFNQKTPFFSVELFGHNLTVFVLCLGFGVLLDVDHIIDFRVNRHRHFENLESQFRKGRMYVVLHSVENALILTILAILLPFFLFPAISYDSHIAMDIYYNDVSFGAYFYVIRFGRKLVRSRLYS
jgi:hypothetical protein